MSLDRLSQIVHQCFMLQASLDRLTTWSTKMDMSVAALGPKLDSIATTVGKLSTDLDAVLGVLTSGIDAADKEAVEAALARLDTINTDLGNLDAKLNPAPPPVV